MQRWRVISAWVAAAALLVGISTSSARAQGSFPDKPIRLIVPFPPGGSADPIGRILAASMERVLNQPIVVENRSGAGGVIGTDAVAKASPDGYTLGLVGVGSMSVAQHIMPKVPYVASRDLVPISLVVAVPQLLVVTPDSPARDLAGLLALAKSQPGSIAYGSSGNGTSPHLSAETLALRAQIEVRHVPYRGVAPAITDVMGGRVQMLFADAPALIGPVRDGKVRALAVGSPERLSALPDVPTVEEAGSRGVDVENWYGLVAPAGTPAARIATIHKSLMTSLADEPTRQKLLGLGTRIIGSSPEVFSSHISSETSKWEEVVNRSKISVE